MNSGLLVGFGAGRVDVLITRAWFGIVCVGVARLTIGALHLARLRSRVIGRAAARLRRSSLRLRRRVGDGMVGFRFRRRSYSVSRAMADFVVLRLYLANGHGSSNSPTSNCCAETLLWHSHWQSTAGWVFAFAQHFQGARAVTIRPLLPANEDDAIGAVGGALGFYLAGDRQRL
jgi:hypothetical protein